MRWSVLSGGTSSGWLCVAVNNLLYGPRQLRLPRESGLEPGGKPGLTAGRGAGGQAGLPSVTGAAAVKATCEDVQRDIRDILIVGLPITIHNGATERSYNEI